MLKSYKYLLAENPINPDVNELFIFSARKNKRGLIQIKTLEISDLYNRSENDFIYTVFFVSKETGLPEFYELSFIDNFDVPEHKISVVLKDAGKWYKNYLIWEEKQISESSNKEPLLKDFSESVKGLKIVYSEFAEKYLVIFRAKIKIFEDSEALFYWLIQDMNIDKKLLSEGFINKPNFL